MVIPKSGDREVEAPHKNISVLTKFYTWTRCSVSSDGILWILVLQKRWGICWSTERQSASQGRLCCI